MLVNADAEPLDDKDLLDRYENMAGVAVCIALLLCLLAFIASWQEWFIDCLCARDPSQAIDGTKDLLPGWNLEPMTPWKARKLLILRRAKNWKTPKSAQARYTAGTRPDRFDGLALARLRRFKR